MLSHRLSSSLGLVGVDLGTRAIKMLQVREHGGALDVLGAASIELTDQDDSGDDLSSRIRASFAAGRFTGRKCVVSLPRSDINLQSIRLPKMPVEELQQAVAWEASQRFGIDRAAMEVDYIRTGACVQSGENREEILIIAASHDVIHERLAPLQAANVRPVALDTGFAALVRLFGRHARRREDTDVRAVVEVGASGATVMILRGDQVALCKPIAIGGDSFNRAVAEHLQIDMRQARGLRAQRIAGSLAGTDAGGDQATDRAVYEAVRPLMGDLVKDVMLCQRYYGVTFRGHPPKEIILTGGDGLEPSLDMMITQACKIPVVFDDERASLDRMAKSERAVRLDCPAARWAAAAGLSLRGIGRSSASRRHREAA